MLYPFIYTRSLYHDFRVVTSKSLTGVPGTIVHLATDVARTLIDAENNQLEEPTWVLVKKDGFLLWGMSALNKVLGEPNQDKEKRPTRGFFGFITDSNIAKLPYSISYFKRLYETYVVPIWDSYEQLYQIIGNAPEISGSDFIEKSSRLNDKINTDDCICRIFPSSSEFKPLIEAVFSYNGDCSIATNVHRKRQCVKFGKEDISFTNAVMSSDSGLKALEDVMVFVPHEIPKVTDIANDTPLENHSNDIQNNPECPICGSSVYNYGDICANCKNEQRNKKFMKYGLYGFLVLICLLLYFKGADIWDMFLSYKQNEAPINNNLPFLRTNKSEITIQDAAQDNVFKIEYQSSSNITQVISPYWIRIVTPSQQLSNEGIIEFCCTPFLGGQREGYVRLTNKDGVRTYITIRQTVKIDRKADSDSNEVNAGPDNHTVITPIIYRDSIQTSVESSKN